MNFTQKQVEAMVREHGLKMTPQRRAIVEYLVTTAHHPTAEEIFTVVNDRFPMTSRATVYNTLHLLKEAALVQEVFEDGVARFDPNLSHHHHFVCRACGKVEDVPGEQFALSEPHFPPEGRRIDSAEVTFRGLCAACFSTNAPKH